MKGNQFEQAVSFCAAHFNKTYYKTTNILKKEQCIGLVFQTRLNKHP